LQYLLLALTAVFLLGAFSTEIVDTDFWWHLKTGEFVLNELRLPVPDPFSYTSSMGEPAYPGEEQVRLFNLTHEWLAQIVWYLVYRAGGFAGLVLWKALLLALVCASAGYLAARRSGNFYAGIAAAFAGVPVAEFFASDRPALVSFVLVPVFVILLERYIEDGRRRWLWPLPVLQLIWANLHGGFFLGWVILGIYSVSAWRWPAERRTPLWGVAALAFLLGGINPNGFRIFEILLRYRQSRLTETLVEWKQPFLWGPPYAYNILLYSSAAAMAASWKKLRLSDALLFIAFAAASLMAFRNVIFLGFIGPVMLARYGWPWVVRLWRRPPPLRIVEGGFTAAAAALIVSYAASGSLFQLRAAEWKFPEATAEFFVENKISQRMFNTYEQGGFWIWRLWPLQKTFVDGRALNESVYEDYRRILWGTSRTNAAENRQQRRRLLDEYGVRIVVMNSFEFTRGTLYPLALDLGNPNREDWKLVFEDTFALVFAKDVPENRALIEQHEKDKGVLAGHLMRECETYIERAPLFPNCARTLGFLFIQTELHGRAHAMLRLYLNSIGHRDAEAEAAFARLSGGGGTVNRDP